jgi:hypothetical protein
VHAHVHVIGHLVHAVKIPLMMQYMMYSPIFVLQGHLSWTSNGKWEDLVDLAGCQGPRLLTVQYVSMCSQKDFLWMVKAIHPMIVLCTIVAILFAYS